MTNPSLDAPVVAHIRLTSGNISEGRGSVLTHKEMTAGNTLDHPDEVKPAALPVAMHGNGTEVSIPPRALVALELTIV